MSDILQASRDRDSAEESAAHLTSSADAAAAVDADSSRITAERGDHQKSCLQASGGDSPAPVASSLEASPCPDTGSGSREAIVESGPNGSKEGST